jgi:predicted aconitase with swiveling domain
LNFDIAVSTSNVPPYAKNIWWRGELKEPTEKPRYLGIKLPAEGLLMGNGCRLTVQPDLGNVQAVKIADSGKGITLSPNAKTKEVKLATTRHLPMRVDCVVDLTKEGTLVIGDTKKFHNLRSGGYASQSVLGVFLDITQDGPVTLTNPKNVIGKVRVDAGKLAVNDMKQLGGAKHIEVAQAGTLHLDFGQNPTEYNGSLAINGGTLQTGTGALSITGDINLKDAKLIIDLPKDIEPDQLTGKKLVIAEIKGKRTGTFASVTVCTKGGTVDKGLIVYEGKKIILDGSKVRVLAKATSIRVSSKR